MNLYTGEKLCDTCFDKRWRKASNTYIEDLWEKNWGLYFIPFVGLGKFAINGLRNIKYKNGNIYHVYINGNHERWSCQEKSYSDQGKCEDCKSFYCLYYELESKE